MKRLTRSPAHCRFCKYIKKPEDFVVKEIIDQRFLRKFQRTSHGVKPVSGYLIFVLKKTNMTTEQAIKNLAKKLNISQKDIGYAGLKDKFAVTYQYMTIRYDKTSEGALEALEIPGIEILEIRNIDKPLSIGDLIANQFEITLHNCKSLKDIKRVPNYFGIQRFGKDIKNHVIGKYIIKRRFNNALQLINEIYRTDYKKINSVPKNQLKFFIHAYQSWLFNKTIEKVKTGLVPIFGYNTKLKKSDSVIKDLLKKEDVSQKNFQISDLRLRCNGSYRKACVNVNIEKIIQVNDILLKFTLPKGSYATTVLKEITS